MGVNGRRVIGKKVTTIRFAMDLKCTKCVGCHGNTEDQSDKL